MQRNTFPSPRDLPRLSQQDAKVALAELQRLVRAGLADVYRRPYTPKGERPRWNIWFSRRACPYGEQRAELPRWAEDWIASQYDEDPYDDERDGGDAA